MKKSIAGRMLRLLVFSALLSAISIVCGKYLAINMGEFMRFSFENLPIIFAGMAFGPLVGALVGIVADLIGCVLVGYAINPIITAAAAVIGFLSGGYFFAQRYFSKNGNISRAARVFLVLVTVAGAHLVGSVIIKSVGLSAFYSAPLHILMLWRLLNYVIVGALEGLILYHLIGNRAIKSQIQKIVGKR